METYVIMLNRKVPDDSKLGDFTTESRHIQKGRVYDGERQDFYCFYR